MENIKTRKSRVLLFFEAILGNEEQLTAEERKELEAIEKASNISEKTGTAFRDKYKKKAEEIKASRTGIKTKDIKTRE